MSRKILNKIVSAILVLAICSTAFIGCVVSAEDPIATYNVHDGETIVARDPDGSVEVTFTSSKPFSSLRFTTEDIADDRWGSINENGWLQISKAEIVKEKTIMADPEAEVFVPVATVSCEFDEEANDHINAVTVDGDASVEKKYYSQLTLKLTFECTYSAEYICQNDGCGWIYDLDEGYVDEENGINYAPGTWYDDFQDKKCPNCDQPNNFRKYKFSYADQYKRFIISVDNVEMTDRGTNVDSLWTAVSAQD